MKAERLTARDEKAGTAYYPQCFEEPCFGIGCEKKECLLKYAAVEKLAKYEDLEEQGKLIKLPCAVGDTVYEILEESVPLTYFYIAEYEVQDVSAKAVKYADDWTPYNYKNLFFTRKEAERKLKEIYSKENNSWILCSERLPEENGTYLCTLDGELVGQEEPFTGMCGFENGEWDEKDCVIAWQEMPEPWKG